MKVLTGEVMHQFVASASDRDDLMVNVVGTFSQFQIVVRRGDRNLKPGDPVRVRVHGHLWWRKYSLLD